MTTAQSWAEFGGQIGGQEGFSLDLKREKLFKIKARRGGRVVECGGLENRGIFH